MDSSNYEKSKKNDFISQAFISDFLWKSEDIRCHPLNVWLSYPIWVNEKTKHLYRNNFGES